MVRLALMLVVAATAALPAQALRVVDDPRAETIGILFRIAGASDFGQGTVQPFIRQVDSAFKPFANHPVFAEIRKLRESDPALTLSAVMSIVPQLSDPVALRERVPFDSRDSRLGPEWHGIAARPFLAQARDFAKVAHLAEFLRFEQPTFDSASARLAREIDSKGGVVWFSRYFGEPAGQIIVSPLLISGGGNFGAEFGSGATHERYAFVSFQAGDKSGSPMLPNEAIEQTAHELSHSFVNHVVAADSMQLRASGLAIFATAGRSMGQMAYSNWRTMYNESLVRVAVIRYLLAINGKEAAMRETRSQQGRGFIWMDKLSELFGEYETHRATYPTLTSFMPRGASFFESVAPQVERMSMDFEAHRPRVLSASIENKANGVDPDTKVIIITFDHAVHGFGNMAGEYGGEIPTLTGGSFDATGTVLTLGIKLVPNHGYWLPFGPGAFADNDGYPLQSWELRFRTR